MNLNWRMLDRWIMGEAWIGSSIYKHLIELCDQIGLRWSSSEAERRTVDYIRQQLLTVGLDNATLEYSLDTWMLNHHRARLVEDELSIQILPFNRCPSFQIEAPLVDVGYGTPHNLEAA